MRDPRYAKLARTLVSHSVRAGSGDRVLVEAFDIPPAFTVELINQIAEAGAVPIASTYQQPVLRALYRNATEDQMKTLGAVERARMEAVQCYIGVRGSNNIAEMSDVPDQRMELYEKHYWRPVHSDVRVRNTRWVVLRWPNSSMAQLAGMSTEGFEDFFFRVCCDVDYSEMARRLQPLKELMEKTDQVHITGPGTDLTFSIKGIPAIPCSGEANIPDGEIFTAPVRDSVNGEITYNAETLYHGTVFSNIHLQFEHGRIVGASAGSQTANLNAILDADEGARYVGEWSLGVNPYVLTPMHDILFDEKIAGSFHLTPGEAYDEADNGNRSQVHWDMVVIQRAEYGGGKIDFDGVPIRRDGLFVLPELQDLNPDRLARATPA